MKNLPSRVLIVLSLLLPVSSRAQATMEERICEPVVIRGIEIPALNGAPLEELFLFAYDAGPDAWRVMPFQIDEVARVPDPFRLPDTVLRYTYFAPDDGLLDSNDELAFMIGDCGDEAGNHWPADSLCSRHPRIEIALVSPDDDTDRRYAYLYRCPAGSCEVPRPYVFSYDMQQQRIATDRYVLAFDPVSGVLRDIAVNPPWGTGVDIFDTQKLRFSGLIDLGAGFPIIMGRSFIPSANERDNLYLYTAADGDRFYHRTSDDPVVRMIREVRQTIRFGTTRLDDLAFYVQSVFYPWSSTVSGGASLDPDELKAMYQTDDDIYIELDLLRQSWDFNAAASGMRFYNPRNQGTLIDGGPDPVDTYMDMPVAEWSLTSGVQGSVFTWVSFTDTSWQDVQLYYHDSESGDQADGTRVRGGDTGDTLSYGDQGVLLRQLAQNSANLELGFTAYFLESGLDGADGAIMGALVAHPAVRRFTLQSRSMQAAEEGAALPARYLLSRNYPNPFNSETVFRCSIPRRGFLSVTMYNLRGEAVRQLYSGDATPGTLSLNWDGRDEQHRPLGSGIYICRLRHGDTILTQTCSLVR
ncbi:T9SS type A sorting domain-containing protein [bacterium]|nr:T9SS type A sorting domain-containing protein [bacterium]